MNNRVSIRQKFQRKEIDIVYPERDNLEDSRILDEGERSQKNLIRRFRWQYQNKFFDHLKKFSQSLEILK